MRIFMRCAGAAALGLALLGGAGAASPGMPEDPQFLPLWMDAVHMDPEAAPAALTLPPGWQTGDAAVVLALGTDWAIGQRDRLVSRFIDVGAAVVELRPTSAETRGHVLAHALVATRVGLGAGVVMAIGDTEAPGAAPAGQRGTTATALLGPDGLRFTPGSAPPPNEAWETRSALFCRLLAAGLRDAGLGEAALGEAGATEAACRLALAP
jgi:hypothetical protein